MLKGIHLTLLIGPRFPVPVPQVVVEALTSVQVNSSNDRSGFQLSFAVSKRSLLLNAMLPAGYFDPMLARVVIIATLSGVPNVIMDGIVTRQELAPSNEPGQSTLTITGEDLSVLMDVEDKTGRQFPFMPHTAQVNLLLGQNAGLGLTPIVIPPMFDEVTPSTEKVATQNGTDLAYIRQLASRHGYIFYIEPTPIPTRNIAYWGPDIRIPIPQPALNVNMDAHTNVESLSFSFDGTAKKIIVQKVMLPKRKDFIEVPTPNISFLRPPLGLKLPIPAKIEKGEEPSAHMTIGEAMARVMAQTSQATQAISASGSLNVLRYGRILRSRMLVGVRGAGIAYDGLYYVDSVTHNLKRGEYKQSFNLSRDGLISNTPRVPV